MRDKMNISNYVPSERLRPFIKMFLIIESEEELVNKVLPDTSLAIAFRFRGRINYLVHNSSNGLPTSVVSGIRKSVRLINYTKDTGNILVLFKEAGAAAFFKEPLHELLGESIALCNLISRTDLSDIEEQLCLVLK
jgi:hypothetical protein